MAYHSERGKIVKVSDYSEYITWYNCAVYNLTLKTESGDLVEVRVKADTPFTEPYRYDAKHTPRMGDVVEVGWDYERFTGEIRERGDGPEIITPPLNPDKKPKLTVSQDLRKSLDPRGDDPAMQALADRIERLDS